MDVISPSKRSELMRRVRPSNTRPELVVRRVVHSLGFRFRLHDAKLPGRPDLVLSRHNLAIFVHGCFWHRHPRCRKSSSPATNTDFWQSKFRANKRRDRRNVRDLTRRGWHVLIVWECETKDLEALRSRLSRVLPAPKVIARRRPQSREKDRLE